MTTPGSARPRRWTRLWVYAVSLLTVVTLTACSSPQEPAVDAARRFAVAVTDSDATTACTLLAPTTKSELEQSAQKTCRDAILDQGLPKTDTDTDTQVYGAAALIRFTNDAVFVARFQGGWKVTAAGCTRIPRRPLDEAPSAYEHFQKKEEGMVKVVFRP